MLVNRNYGDKLGKLKEKVTEKENILVAFSGGVDSGLLVKVARDTLDKNALGIILNAEIMPRSEIRQAENLATFLSIEYEIVKFPIMHKEEFIKNPLKRCYLCKKASSRILKKIASDKGINCIADGVNLSDFNEHRPGIKACDEEGIWHPFVEVGITKADIRGISKELGLSFWNKPSSACLATRIPYGEEITKAKLSMVEIAEEVLKKEGFKQVRVRAHRGIARIEVLEDEFKMLLAVKKEIRKELKRIGFKYVTLDLEGYRSGSMDEVL
jgi:uncharacterized protein